MSKTFGRILLVAGAIAINVIPGIGQAISATIVGLGGGTFAAAGIAATVTNALVAGVTLAGASAALSAGASLLGLGPKIPKPEQTQTSIKSPVPTRLHANGARRLYGASLLYATSANGRTVDVWAYSDSHLNAVLQIYLNDDKVTVVSEHVVASAPDGRYGNKILAGWNVGLPTETAFSSVVSELPGIWTTDHRGDGMVTGYMIKYQVAEKAYLKTYPQGDNITMSIAGEWGLHFDPRDPAQDAYDQETWVYSENAAVHFLTYLIKFRALDWNLQGAPQLARITAALDDCDIAQPLQAGGTEPRYRGCVVFKSTDEPAAIISEMLSCFDGWYCFNEEDQLILYSGRYYMPTVTIDSDQIVSYRDTGGTAIEDRLNEVKITYVSAAHDYAEVEADPWRDEDAIVESGREPNSTTASIQSPSFTQNRRLAKRMLSRINAGDKFTITTTFGGQAALGQRYINLTIAEGTYIGYSGPVEILTSPETDLTTGGLTFECCTVDPNIDAWNPATEDGYGAPLGEVIYRAPLAPPEIDTAVAVYEAAVDNSGTGVRIQITINSDIEGATWFARSRKDTSSVWNEQEYTDADPAGGVVTLLTDFVPVDPSIYVEVLYRSADGRYSDWSSPATIVDTRTDVTPPDAAGVITLVSWADALSLSTDTIPRASSYRWRFYDPSNLTTPIRTITTSSRTVMYTAAQAEVDGVRRDYVVTVAGVNAAGAGTEATSSTLTNAAPSTVTGVSATGGATDAEIDFDLLAESDIAGYVAYTSTNTGFDPLIEGFASYNNGAPPFYLQGLAAGTFYSIVAAYDAWSQRPDLLNFSTETSFTITTGGGGSGGGGGGGGGGYCPTVDTLILLANESGDGGGNLIRAGDLTLGVMLWTRPELANGSIGEWGSYPVSAIAFAEDTVYRADIGIQPMRATADHRIWLGSGWVKMKDIGVQDGTAMVAKITVKDAHTYIANGLLNHNLKPEPPEIP